MNDRGEARLSPVFPNPFNQSALFNIELSQASTVRVLLYDLKGQRAVLQEGALQRTYQFSISGLALD